MRPCRKFRVGDKVRLIPSFRPYFAKFQGKGVVAGYKDGMVVVRFPKRAQFAPWLLERAR